MRPSRSRPRRLAIIDNKSGELLMRDVADARGWLTTGIGLLLSPKAVGPNAVLLRGVGAIHTAGMRYPIDIAFFDAAGLCLRRIDRLAPWRVALGPRGTASVLETKAATPSVLLDIAPGTRVSIRAQADL